MSSQTSSFTDSALSDKVKEFLTRFKDKQGNYKYVDAVDSMMPKNAKYIVVDYNDFVTEPEIEIIFSENPDRIFDAFGRAIKEALQTRFPEYAEKIKEEVDHYCLELLLAYGQSIVGAKIKPKYVFYNNKL